MKSRPVKYCSFLLALILQSGIGHSQTKYNRIFNDSTVKISEISTNVVPSGFSPTVINGTLFITSFNDKVSSKKEDKRGKKKYYDLYKIGIDKNGDLISKSEPFKDITSRYNDGPIAWCEKTGELFITQNYIDQSIKRKPFQDEIIRLRIIIARQNEGEWEYAGEFPFFSSEYSVGHPAITESGDTLIFSSDMPGGFGETDLYYSVRRNGKWDVPVNLGPNINTAGKEEFAYITDRHFDGSYLIFSSTGRNGKGGLDLYFTRFPSDYSEIGHFEEPINTKNDDFAMTIPPDADFGFLTSNRSDKGDDNIYKFTFNRTIKNQDKLKEVSLTVKDTLHAAPVKYPTNQRIVLRNIYYDFDKWDILPESAAELDKLVEYMKANPEYIVELASHTDERGTKQYNLKLSQLRANAAIDYVISKGIDKSQIFGTGYGKSRLIHKCAPFPCTPAQHRENRRTEIYITEVLKGQPNKQDKGDYSNGQPDHKSAFISPKKPGMSLKIGSERNISTANTVKYYVILNSFKEKTKASDFVREIKSEGYSPEILSDIGFLRVGIGYDRLNDAKKALKDFKVKGRKGWIYESH